MPRSPSARHLLAAALVTLAPGLAQAQRRGGADWADSIKYTYQSNAKLDALKAEAAKEIDAKAKMIQEIGRAHV